MGKTKTQVEASTAAKVAPDVTPEKLQAAPEPQKGPIGLQRQTASVTPPPNGTPPASRVASVVNQPAAVTHAPARAQMSNALQRNIGNARLLRMIGVQAKIPIGAPGDRYEQEADDVAARVVSGQSIARISRIGTVGQATPVSRSALKEQEEEPIQTMPVQRQADEEEMIQAMPVQRQAEEEEEPVQAIPVQRQAEEEEEPIQAIPVQRQPEEKEEPVQTIPVQRQVEEEEEPVQAISVQRQAEEEEEPVQAIPVQRQAEEEEEPVQAIPVQRQAEEEEPLQGFALQRQPEKEEKEEAPPIQSQRLQRQGEELPEEPGGEEPWPEPSDTEMQAAEEGVQAKADSTGGESVEDSGVESRVRSPGGGRLLSEGVKSKMETSMGADFSGVRVHDNAQDQDDAKSLGAKAFAYKNDVWLGKGASDSDPKLMAHELTHVVQQGAAVQKATEEESEEKTETKKAKQTTAQIVPKISRSPQKVQRAGGILGKIAEYAREIPGYHLLSVIIGRDPISSEPVPRTAANVIKGIIGLIPGGNALYENLNKTGAIEKAGAWLSKQIDALGFTWAYIKGLFGQAWDALAWYDLALPWRAFSKIKKVFSQPVKRLFNFAKAIGNKILEFIFEGAMALAGGLGKKVLGYLKKAGSFFLQIIKDPIGFIGNLVKALAKGFGKFSANIWSHLKAGLLGWLFGALANSGLQMPDKLDLKGILSLAMQILGVTYQAIRKRIVKVIGEKRMARVEKTVSFVADLLTRGPIAAWEMISGAIGNLKDIVLGAIQNWVVTKIVKSAVIKLVSMFNPAGAIIQAAMAIYNTVMFFIERAQQIAELVNSVFSSISKIAAGAVGAAANFIEQTMARTLPVIISFLARLIGLGGVGEKVKGIIKRIQKPISKGIGKVVSFVVGKVKKLFGKGKSKGKELIQKVIQWWKIRKKVTFKNGEKHTLFFKGTGKNTKLFMKSKELSLEQKISQIEDKEKKSKLEKLYVDGVVGPINKNAGQKLPKNEQARFQQQIAAALVRIGKELGDTDAVPPTAVTHKTEGGKASVVTAAPLSNKAGNTSGSEAKAKPLGWNIANWLNSNTKDPDKTTSSGKNKRIIKWRRVHLLSHLLHGPGDQAWNLTPTIQKVNSLLQVQESKVQGEIKDGSTYYKMYRTVVEYNNPDNEQTHPQAGTWNTNQFPSKVTLLTQKESESSPKTIPIRSDLPAPNLNNLIPSVDYFAELKQNINIYFAVTKPKDRKLWSKFAAQNLNLDRIQNDNERADVRMKLKKYYRDLQKQGGSS